MKNNKRIIALFLLICMCLSFAACKDDKKKELPKEDEGEKTVHYKDTMVEYDKLTKADRIVILQTSLVFNGREGIYKEAEIEKAVTIKYQEKEVPALKIKNCTKFFLNSFDSIDIYGKNGDKVSLTSNDFNEAFVLSMAGDEYIEDFKKGTKTLLVNSKGNLIIDDFSYAITNTKEGILNVNSKEEIQMTTILENFGWDQEKTVYIVASDKFYVPDTLVDGQRGAILGILSGTSVNAKIQDLTIAQGKINDILYIEKIAEDK